MDETVRKLTELQYRLIPLARRGKRPLISQWPNKASYDPTVIQGWIDAFPGCNWGVATGRASGIVVIDIDPRHGGDVQWTRLSMNHRPIVTATCKTGGGGVHYYFSLPAGTHIGNAVGLSSYDGIDVRADGGQVVVPPSTHESGGTYTWERAPWETPPIPIPDWLLQLMNAAAPTQVMGDPLVAGQRNNSMFHQALMLARQGALTEFTISAMRAWRDNSGASDVTDDEIEKTVDSAYKRASQEKDARSNQSAQRTDSDNADRIIKIYGEKLRYAPGYGWLVWNTKVWAPDEENAKVINLATESMLMLRDEALEEAKTPENFKSALAKAQWAMNSLNIGRLRASVDLASTRDKIRVAMDKLDSRETRFMLNTLNGVVNLKTGELTPHDPNLLITKMVNFNYNPTATAPFWERTLHLAFDGNQALIDYMQRAIGYSITGSVAEQCLFICWGEQGNNGKSTILETLQWLLSPYSQMSDMKVITSPEMDNRVASSLAKLPGVRLVSMNEADENQKLSEALVKQLTGGDTLQACKKFHEPFEFPPVFKLWIRTNEKPQIRGMSDAIWRRIKLIPFLRPIPAAERKSRDEVDDTLHNEAEGILNWCIQGAIRWSAEGLKDPQEVSAATAGYRTEMDIIQTFFDECVTERPGESIGRAELYQVFVHWARENGLHYIMTADAFGKRVSRKTGQTDRVKVRGQYVWSGIGLTEFAHNSLIS